MLIVQQIVGLIIAGFSVLFMLWFLSGLIRESRTRYRHRVPPPVANADSWQARALGPQAPISSVGGPRNSGKGALRPEPQFGQSLRPLHTSSR